MPRPNKILNLLREVEQGEIVSPATNRRARKRCRHDSAIPSPIVAWLRGVHADEAGQMTFLGPVIMLFLIMLICYMGNAGVSVRDKLELQNATDTASHSTALWMARGMNAVTTTNHLIGEATAVLVMIDSFAGTEGGGNSNRSLEFNNKLRILKESGKASFTPISGVVRQVADERIVNFVSDRILNDTPNGKHDSGAAIYDAQLTLKFITESALTIKTVASIAATVTQVFPPVGVPVDAAAAGIHTVLDVTLIRVGQEWITLQGMEKVLIGLKQLKIPLEQALIPALSLYARSIVGEQLGGTGVGEVTQVNRGVRDTLANLEKAYSAQRVKLEVYPAWDKIRLPLIREPAAPPTGPTEQPPSLWRGENPSLERQALETVFSPMKRLIDIAQDIVDAAKAITNLIPIAGEYIDKYTKLAGVDPPVLPSFPRRPDPIWADNPTKRNLPRFDWQAESRTQWVRATYPYVDSYRAPLLAFFGTALQVSEMEDWYTHWSNRMTLVVARRVRQASPFSTMYVLRDFNSSRKGEEPWTTDNAQAEEMFTVLVVGHQPKKPANFAGMWFKKERTTGTAAISQAMVYNANGRDPNQGGGDNQPNTGWDTLNWNAPVRAPEWSGRNPTTSGGGAPMAFLTGGHTHHATAQAKINWQSKLVPVTGSKLQRARVDVLKSKFTTEASKLLELLSTYPELVHN